MTGQAVADVAERLQLSEACGYGYVRAFILKGVSSLAYRAPTGRPAKLTKTQKKELMRLIDKGPEAAGYDLGGWTTALIQDLIWRTFQVKYSVQYVAALLKNLGYSWQKARFASEHLDEVRKEQREWSEQKWPEILRVAKEKNALILFGSQFCAMGHPELHLGAQGSSAHRQNERQTPRLQGVGLYRVLFGGVVLYDPDRQAELGPVPSLSQKVLAKTKQHLILIQDGTRYHTRAAMKQFFATHAERLTVEQLPRYSPDLNSFS
jgi:transposase